MFDLFLFLGILFLGFLFTAGILGILFFVIMNFKDKYDENSDNDDERKCWPPYWRLAF